METFGPSSSPPLLQATGPAAIVTSIAGVDASSIASSRSVSSASCSSSLSLRFAHACHLVGLPSAEYLVEELIQLLVLVSVASMPLTILSNFSAGVGKYCHL